MSAALSTTAPPMPRNASNRRRSDHAAPSDLGQRRPVSRARVAQLAHDLCGAIMLRTGGRQGLHDATLESVVTHSIHALLADVHHPATAAERVADKLRKIGEREAASGRSFCHIEEAFALAEETANAHVNMLLMTRELSRGIVSAVRPSLNAYLTHLLSHVRRGYDDYSAISAISPDEARRALRRLFFDPQATASPEHLCAVARRAGLSTDCWLVPLIGVGAPLSSSLAPERELVPGLSANEAVLVLTSDTGADEQALLDASPEGLLVIGTRAQVVDVSRALVSARRAAGMLTAGLLPRPEGALLCDRVLGSLASCSDPYVTRLLVDKHLGWLMDLKPQRRYDLSRLLLQWLSTGRAVNELARDLSISAATLHSQMRVLRKQFGSSLDEPEPRMELLMALRVMLPLWSEGVSTQ